MTGALPVLASAAPGAPRAWRRARHGRPIPRVARDRFAGLAAAAIARVGGVRAAG